VRLHNQQDIQHSGTAHAFHHWEHATKVPIQSRLQVRQANSTALFMFHIQCAGCTSHLTSASSCTVSASALLPICIGTALALPKSVSTASYPRTTCNSTPYVAAQAQQAGHT
jgi:hypothetical protein